MVNKARHFWQTVRPYLSDKGENHHDIMLCKDDELVSDPDIVASMFNDYFTTFTDGIGITEEINGISIIEINEKYKDHPSIIKIEYKYSGNVFTLKQVSVNNIEKLLSNMNPRKATGFDQLPPKLLRIAGSAIAPSMTALVNNTILCAQFPANLKCAERSPVFKKENILDETKCKPISILQCISKVMECVVNNQMCAYFHDILDVRLSAFRKNYNTQSILVKAVEGLRKALDNGKYVGAILMDLSKAFDVIPYGLYGKEKQHKLLKIL